MERETAFSRYIGRGRSSLLVTGFLLALLVLGGPLRSVSLRPPEVQAQDVTLCDDENPHAGNIVHDCDLNLEGFSNLEFDAIEALLALHQLPESDRSRILAWERDAVRALMFSELIEMALKEPGDRTALEHSIVAAMADVVRQRRIDAAQFSIDQYNAWEANPCTYQAPHGFTYETDDAWCSLPLVQLFDHPDAPTVSDFLNYGFAEINQEFEDGGDGQLIAGETARWMGVVGGALAVAVAAWVGGVIGSALATTTSIVTAIHPTLAALVALHAKLGTVIGAVKGAAAAASGALSIGAMAAIIVLAVVIIVVQAISVIEQTQIPVLLEEALTQAQDGIDLRQLAQSEGGKVEIYTAFLLKTLPDFPNSGSVPAAQATDRTFIITDAQGNREHSPTLSYQCWNPRDCQDTDLEHTARIHEGWFVDKSDATGTERMTIDIDYIDWNGDGWTASRIGPQEFLHTRTGDDEAEPFVSEEIKYLDHSGAQLTAVLNHPPTTPGTPVPDDTVNNGTFQLNWSPAATDADGDPVTYTLIRCDENAIVIGIDCVESEVATGLTTTSYTFTDSEPEIAGFFKYSVQASDGRLQGDRSAWSVEVLVDRQPPEITFSSRTPAANADGWNNSDVTVEWTCSDTEPDFLDDPSGVVAETVSETVTTEGANQSVTGVCEDNAGNTTSATVDGISIDKTAPTPLFDGPYVVDEGSSILLSSALASDALSGIGSAAFALDGDDQFDDGDSVTFNGIEGPSVHPIKLRVEDRAGNVSIAETTITVNNAAPQVNPPTVDIEPSNEGQSVVASATFSDPGVLDSQICTVDYGDGSGPQAGTISDDTCTGPAHTYADDEPTGTSSDDYTVAVVVTDDDGASGDSSTVQTVNNLPPVIDGIATNGPVAQGQPATITVTASDVGGVNDPLSYAFDCDEDGVFEVGPQPDNATSCTLDPAAAITTIGVQVSDDDLGVATGSVEVGQTVTLCASTWTGAISLPGSGGTCRTGSLALTLPAANPTTLCIDRFTGGLTWVPNGTCPSGRTPHVVPDSGSLPYCVSHWTGNVRANLAAGPCRSGETPGVIPGAEGSTAPRRR